MFVAGTITDPAILTITEHYIGITIASMPALKPLFTKVLGATVASQSSSKRSFQKIESPGAGVAVPRPNTASGRSSLRGNKIRVKTEFRVSSQLELEVGRDYELSDAALPGFLRQQSSNNSWARGSDMEAAHNPAIRTGGGYTHIDDAPDFSSGPQTSPGVRSKEGSQ
ncbi:MAG: hypothetical protein L6R39_000651 [Caloplaca ligustica]|nr:MAG: hypothetical protein L6R39_000651 [Caloplaca ligustica]